LNTDMVNHFGNVGKLQNFYEVSGEEVSSFVSAIAMGAADVAAGSPCMSGTPTGN